MSERVLLSGEDLRVSYGRLLALEHADIRVHTGEIVCLLGPNGAGKSTIVNAIAGIRKLDAGCITLDGDDITSEAAHRRVGRGISLVPERRRLFPDMTVLENIQVGAIALPSGERRDRVARILERFPLLQSRANQAAATLSGGEQQLVALARGLVSGPRLLMVDEPFLGLSPSARKEVVRVFTGFAERDGVGVLFIEQNVKISLEVSDRAYVMQAGRVAADGPTADFDDERVRRIFLGV